MIFSLVLLLLFILLVVLRVNIGFSIGIVTILYLLIGDTTIPLQEMVFNTFQSLDRYPMLAVPLFIFAGQLMSTGGIAKYFLRLSDEIVGGMKGGYAFVTMLACLFFANLSGSAPATVAAIGALMIPAMIKQGYHPGFATALVACAGVWSIVIPPSNPFIIYALANNASIGKLFLAGFLPGFVLALGIAIPAYFISRINGWGGEVRQRTFKAFIKAFWDAKWAMLVPIIILGGIYSGLFTPTESAAVACVYAAIIGLFIYKEFGIKDLPNIISKTALSVATLFTVVVFAANLGVILTMNQVPQALANAITSATTNPFFILLIINGLLLFIGTFMDPAAAIIILAPILYPLAARTGMNEIQFGVMMIINLGIGFVTPPFGTNLFVANQMTGLKIQVVFKHAIPLVAGMIVALMIVTYIPWVSNSVPDFFYGR
jgi:C4-dicarboxylate transporter, DctM subunit